MLSDSYKADLSQLRSPLSQSSSGILDGGYSIVVSPGEQLSAISSRDPICLQLRLACCITRSSEDKIPFIRL